MYWPCCCCRFLRGRVTSLQFARSSCQYNVPTWLCRSSTFGHCLGVILGNISCVYGQQPRRWLGQACSKSRLLKLHTGKPFTSPDLHVVLQGLPMNNRTKWSSSRAGKDFHGFLLSSKLSSSFACRLVEPGPHIILPMLLEMAIRPNIIMPRHGLPLLQKVLINQNQFLQNAFESLRDLPLYCKVRLPTSGSPKLCEGGIYTGSCLLSCRVVYVVVEIHVIATYLP